MTRDEVRAIDVKPVRLVAVAIVVFGTLESRSQSH